MNIETKLTASNGIKAFPQNSGFHSRFSIRALFLGFLSPSIWYIEDWSICDHVQRPQKFSLVVRTVCGCTSIAYFIQMFARWHMKYARVYGVWDRCEQMYKQSSAHFSIWRERNFYVRSQNIIWLNGRNALGEWRSKKGRIYLYVL